MRRGSGSGSYVLEIDDHLLGLVNRLASRTEPVTSTSPPVEEPEPDRVRGQLRSFLSPREIQARLRAGFSIAEVAQEAGVEESWVERFAPPVLAEREQVVNRGRDLVFSRPRAGPSALSLGDSVRFRLEARGVRLLEDAFDGGWSAQHLESTRWILGFRFDHDGEEQAAEWEVDFSEGTLAGLDKAASALAYVSPGDQSGAQDSDDAAGSAGEGTGSSRGPANAAKATRSTKRPTSRATASGTSRGATGRASDAANVRQRPTATKPTASAAKPRPARAPQGSPPASPRGAPAPRSAQRPAPAPGAPPATPPRPAS
ncbi:MAG: septation protein SepH, partial [Acidimicrobiales bacterium]